eukprot:scaffold240218_cov19-Tisochrysis_lutea.AAC.1
MKVSMRDWACKDEYARAHAMHGHKIQGASLCSSGLQRLGLGHESLDIGSGSASSRARVCMCVFVMGTKEGVRQP